MKEKENVFFIVKAFFVGIGNSFSTAFGWLGWLMVIWAGCMAMDYLTGSLAAASKGEWSSARARAGIWHKGGMICIVVVATIVDLLFCTVRQQTGIELPFPVDTMLLPLTLIWYTITELGSICENAAAMGAPVPAPLLNALQMAHEAVKRTEDDTPNSDT